MRRSIPFLDHIKRYLGIFTLTVLASCFYTAQANASTVVPADQIELVYKGLVTHRATEGSTVTKQYYVYTDLKYDDEPGIVHFIDRATGTEAHQVVGRWGHMSGLDHEWGSNYVRVSNSKDANKDGCIDMATFQTVELNKCINRLKHTTQSTIAQNINKKLSQQAVPIMFNGYYFKTGFRHAGNKSSYVNIFNQKGKLLDTVRIPREYVTCTEIEDVSFDGDTGDAYVSYNCNGKDNSGNHFDFITVYRIGQAVFGKYSAVNQPESPSQPQTPTQSESPSQPQTPTQSESPSQPQPSPQPESTPVATPTQSSTPTPAATPMSPSQSEPQPQANEATQPSEQGKSVTTTTSNQSTNCVKTLLLGDVCDEDGILKVLQLVVDILSVGVGIVGVIGIMLVGIQYLTANDNQAKVTKAKQRILEISIGLVVYALAFALLKWLGVA